MNDVENIKEICSYFIQSRRKYTPTRISLRRNIKGPLLRFFCHFKNIHSVGTPIDVQIETSHRRNDLFLGVSNFLPVLYILGWLEKMNDFSTLQKVNLNTSNTVFFSRCNFYFGIVCWALFKYFFIMYSSQHSIEPVGINPSHHFYRFVFVCLPYSHTHPFTQNNSVQTIGMRKKEEEEKWADIKEQNA